MHFSIFIADTHLSEYTPDKVLHFQRLLETDARNADAVYILGDLFEIWVGDDDETPFNSQIKNLLKQFRETTNIPIFIIPGNHDFLLGPKFAKDTNCQFLTDPCLINLYDRSTLLAHGDQFCTDNRGYMLMRKILYNRYWQKFFLFLPLKLRKIMAKELRDRSLKKRTKHIRPCLTQHSMIATMEKHNALQLIHGHGHSFENNLLQVKGKEARQIALNSWDDGANILFYYADHKIINKTL
jgi:UDP-2,3-diacylglucosamine hydrolase